MLPRITIGLPCYNAEETILRALNSAMAQDWPNLEIVVVDDDSDDNSVSLIKQVATADPRVRLYENTKNSGAGATRDRILREASGEYIAFFDDDDESDLNRVRLQYQRILDYERATGAQLVACYASGTRVYSNGYQLALRAIGSRGPSPVGTEIADYLLFNGRISDRDYGSGTPTCALMIRKSSADAVGGFDPSFRRVEDVDFAVRLGLHGAHFVGCPEMLFTQYATTGSDKTPEANLEAELRLLDKHRRYLNAKRRFTYAKAWFQFRYHHFNNQRLRALIVLANVWIRHPLLVFRHLARSLPARLLHERRMARRR